MKTYIRHTAVSVTQFQLFVCIDINVILIYKSKIKGTPTTSLTFQLPSPVENSKWHQFIARTMFYCHELRYINNAFSGKQDLIHFGEAQLFSQFFETLWLIQPPFERFYCKGSKFYILLM